MKKFFETKLIAVIAILASVVATAQELPPPPPLDEMGDGFGGEETPINMYIPLLVIFAISIAIYYYRRISVSTK